MNYEKIFDAGTAVYWQWVFALLGVPFLVAGVALLRAYRATPTPEKRPLGCLAVVVGLIFPISSVRLTYSEYQDLKSSLERGRFIVVEGAVEDFDPKLPGERGMETFVVAGRRYAYTDAALTAAFNQTRAKGGPIEAGLRVRIADVDGKIARLEIAR